MSPTAATEMPSRIRNDALFQNSSHLSQYSRWIPWVSKHRAISSGAPRKNHTTETRHLAGSIRDVGPADHCGSVAVVLSKCGFRGASSVTRCKFKCAAGGFPVQKSDGLAD